MKYIATTLVSALLLIGFSASAQTGTISVFSSPYNAKCDGQTNDTAAFQSAATAAATRYASTGSPVTITYAGNCVIGTQTQPSLGISYGSGVHWRGYGLITVPIQGGTPTFYAKNANDVEWDHVEIQVGTPFSGSNPYAAGIGWFATTPDSTNYGGVKVTHCRVSNSNWGISIFYNSGSGGLTDVEVDNSSVTSDLVYSNFDGIHVAGQVSNIRIHDNIVTNRGDGAISLTTEYSTNRNPPAETLSGAIIENNMLTQDSVGIDISGASNVDISGNFVEATASTGPAFRQIYYCSGKGPANCTGGYNGYPVNIHTHGNTFEAGAGSYVVKIDADAGVQWSALNSTFEKNKIAGFNNTGLLYIRGSGLFIDGNTFTSSGGTFFIDYDGAGFVTSNILIGSNWWFGNGTVETGANPSLLTNIQMAPQIGTGTIQCINTNYPNPPDNCLVTFINY
jgi:hypothetical protein